MGSLAEDPLVVDPRADTTADAVEPGDEDNETADEDNVSAEEVVEPEEDAEPASEDDDPASEERVADRVADCMESSLSLV